MASVTKYLPTHLRDTLLSRLEPGYRETGFVRAWSQPSNGMPNADAAGKIQNIKAKSRPSVICFLSKCFTHRLELGKCS